jgi:predicted phosphodiesterase
MRVALLSDIHGNLVALEAALGDLATQEVEQVVCLGDIALSGPQPHECVALIHALGCPTVMGNCDDSALRMRDHTLDTLQSPSRWGAWVARIDQWSAEALTDDDAAFIAALPMTVSIPLGPGVTLLCAHGSPQSFNHRLMPETPIEKTLALVGQIDAVALASGHTHFPMLRRFDTFAIVNPGSIGLPLATDATGATYNPSSYADYAIVTWEADTLDWEPRRVAVDEAAVRAAALASGMPHADRWRGDWSRP